MEEFTIEQKAKLYDEAIKRAKAMIPIAANHEEIYNSVITIFPELAENEDEKIRKALIFHFQGDGYLCNKVGNIPNTDILAWLEKQGEKKPVEKVEPKFKVGNWYQCTKDFFGKGVTFDKNTAYYCAIEGCLQNEYGCHIAFVKDLYDNFKLWTIQDAKDGDVLVCTDYGYNSYILFGEKNIHCWYNGQTEHFHPTTSCKLRKDATIHPATKEQRDLLFQKMKEAGYEWDAEKKELKKIEQKPAWSEEDERIYQSILDDTVQENQLCDEQTNWLKSLRLQNRWKPSDEQMKALWDSIPENVLNISEREMLLNSLYKDLKKL